MQIHTHQSPTLQRLEQQAQTQQARWQRLSQLALGCLALVIIGGFIAAWRLEPKETQQVLKRASNPLHQLIEQPTSTIPSGDTIWLNNHMQRWHGFLWANTPTTAMFVAAIIALAVLHQGQNLGNVYIALAVMSLFYLVCMFWAQRALSQQYIGIQDQQLLLEQAPNKRTIVPFEQLQYSQQCLLSEQVCVVLQSSHFPLFARQQLHQHLYPRLKSAQPVGFWRAQKQLYHTRHPELFLQFVPLLGIVLAGAILWL